MSSTNKILFWLDLHRQTYLWPVGGLIIAALILALRPLLREDGAQPDVRRHDWWWGMMILAILVAGRWPTFLLGREFSPDEGQLLAGARVLLHDPVFWRSVDGASSGPFNFMALWPAGLLCGWDSYLPARFTSLGLLAITLTLAHQCMSLVLGRRVARLAGLTAVCLEAMSNSVDFLHYSTELMPMALLVAACYAAIRRWLAPGGGPGWNALGGLLLGAAPLAKLQIVPMAAPLGFCWLVAELRCTGPEAPRRRLYLLAGALLPAALFAAQITAAGEWWNVILPYFHYNIHYTQAGSLPLPRLLDMLLDISIEQDSLMHLFLAGCAGWLLLTLRFTRHPDPAARIFTMAAVAACALALYSACYPGRPFPHYWQLTVAPFVFLLGAQTATLLASPPAWRRSARWLVAACAIGAVGLMLQQRASKPNICIGAFTYMRQHPRSELATRVAAHARPGESIAIWGWTSYVYIEANLLQATRDAHFERAVAAGPYQRYFRQRFLADLINSKPALFLDSASRFSLTYQDPKFTHDQSYPELAALIREQYVLVDEVLGARIYRRRDAISP